MRNWRWMLLFAVIPGAAMAGTGETCPWLNAATAGGVLGGDVMTQVSLAEGNHSDGTCTFERRGGKIASTLSVQVITMPASRTNFASYESPCGSHKTALSAIGNEAVACDGHHHSERWEFVAGRVRDRAFTIRIQTNDRSISSGMLAEKGRLMAEEVAGILF